MSKSSKITASELVLSAIFFLQKKNGVTAKDLTKFICEKRGCRQSLVRSEVKKALERATENGIFSKKRGLYRIESGFGKNKISIKVNRGTPRNKKVKKMKRSTSMKPVDEEAFGDPADAPLFAPAMDVPTLSSRKSYTKHTCPGERLLALADGLKGKASVRKILMQHMKCPKNALEDDDDEDDDDDFLEDEDDEDDIDYFADDLFPSAEDAVKEYPVSDPEPEPEPETEQKKREPGKRKIQSRSKSRTKGKPKRRKLSKPKRKVGKRKRNPATRRPAKKNNGESKRDENAEEGEEHANMELDSQGEENYGEGDEGSDCETENCEYNEEDYECDDYDDSDEEYLKQQEKDNKGVEQKDTVPKREEEGDKKNTSQHSMMQNVKVNQTTNAEGKVTSDSSQATPTAPKQREAGNQDKNSKSIRSSSLFNSFKKKNEAKNSAVERKQVKSRM